MRRFREHLREIRRLAGETQQQVRDVRDELRLKLAPLDSLVRDHADALSRIEAQIEELAEQAEAFQATQVSDPILQSGDDEASLSEWEFVPEGWERSPVRGWDADQVARSYTERWSEFLQAVEGPGPLGVSHEVPLESPIEREDPLAQNMVLAWAYVLARAADGVRQLAVMDWGGALGQYQVFARKLFPDLELDYHCRELPAVCEQGRRLQPDVVFHDDDACLNRSFDLVIASNSLQYEEDWQSRLRSLAQAAKRWLFVTRVPLAHSEPSFVVLQRANHYGYGTEYLGWVLNRDELLEGARDAGLTLVREFSLLWPHTIEGAPEPAADGGFLFRRTRERV